MNKKKKLFAVALILLLVIIQTKSYGQIISDVNHLNITRIKLAYINSTLKGL